MAYLFVTLASTILAVYMAEKRGRSMVLAIVGGLLFGLLSCLYYLIVGDSKEQRAMKQVLELLRQEKEIARNRTIKKKNNEATN